MRNVDDGGDPKGTEAKGADPKEGCNHRRTCPMFELFETADQLNYWKRRYCNAEFTKCARYQTMLVGETPPAHLLPSGRLLRLG